MLSIDQIRRDPDLVRRALQSWGKPARFRNCWSWMRNGKLRPMNSAAAAIRSTAIYEAVELFKAEQTATEVSIMQLAAGETSQEEKEVQK